MLGKPYSRYGTALCLLLLSPGVPALAASRGHAGSNQRNVSKLAGLTEHQKIDLVLNRLAFGPRPGDVAAVRSMGLMNWIDQQLHPELIDDSYVDAQLTRLQALDMPNSDLMEAFKEDQEMARQRALLNKAAQQQTQLPSPQAATGAAPPQAIPQPMVTGQQLMTLQAGSDLVASNIGPNGLRPQRPDAAGPAGNQQPGPFQTPVDAEPTMLPGTSNEVLGELVDSKALRAIDSNRQLQEVLVDFWSNHFNLDVNKGPVRDLILADERDVIRPHVLGKFRDLLEASAKSPAMLWYLDNYLSTRNPTAANPLYRGRFSQSLPVFTVAGAPGTTPAAGAPPAAAPRRGGLNENYGRELMELHTLGVDGGYTQQDVTEVARCFTGWSINPQTGEFEFFPRRHDDGQKIVLGHVIPAGGGMQDGETVLDILASSPACAHFISKELCERLVSDNPPADLVNQAAATFIRTQGDLREVVRTIVTSPVFFSPQTYKAKVKSPFEFAVSAVRAVNGHYIVPDPDNNLGRRTLLADASVSMRRAGPRYGARLEPSLIQDVASMGQPLFAYEAPTGYPEISSRWVSSGGLLARFNFATALGQDSVTEVSDNPGELIGSVSLMDHDAVLNTLAGDILNGEVSPNTRSAILDAMPANGPADPAQVAALLIGSPEFEHR